MGKIVLWYIFTVAVFAQTKSLERHCLDCHKLQQIPNTLIYRRYLLKYSSPKRIEEAMFLYLKNPKKMDSIMPPQFFLKFPMKSALNLNDFMLKKEIQAYIETLDIKKKLRINK